MKKVVAHPALELKTEAPLKERDQQGLAAERARKLGEEALAQWRRLNRKAVMEKK